MEQKIRAERQAPDSLATKKFIEVLHLLQKTDTEFPLQYALCLAEISVDEGLSLTALAERVNLSLSTVSRIVGALSDYRTNGQPYGLVELRISTEERRRKELYLTVKGRALIQKIGKIVE